MRFLSREIGVGSAAMRSDPPRYRAARADREPPGRPAPIADLPAASPYVTAASAMIALLGGSAGIA
jgi:hypothetical protein